VDREIRVLEGEPGTARIVGASEPRQVSKAATPFGLWTTGSRRALLTPQFSCVPRSAQPRSAIKSPETSQAAASVL
jgi:hypothetical protein